MLRRDWLRYAAALTLQLLALAFALQAIVGVWSAYQNNLNGYREYQKRDGQDQRKAAEEIAQRCAALDQINPVLRECLREAIVGYQKTQHDDRDLQAQQEMAFWALVSAIVAACGLIVSMAGVGIVWQSLKQTRTAILNDREIGEAQIRAYLTVEPPTNSGLDKVGAGITPSMNLKIINTGQSPAYDVKYVAALMIEEYPLPIDQGDLLVPHPSSIEQGATVAAQAHIGAIAKLDQPMTGDESESVMNEGKQRLFAVCIVTYFDVFKRHMRKTKFCAHLIKVGDPIVSNGRVVHRYEWALANVHNDAT